MYLEVDFTKTFARLRAYSEIYNNHLRIESPEKFRKQSIKSTHIETAKEIVRFYGAYLYKNKNQKLDQSRRFWITNTGVAKNKLQHSTTIYRHIVFLLECGIVTNKIFHGSNYGIEVEINPELLVFKNNAQLSKQWILSELERTAPTLDTYNTSCKDNDPNHFQETNNLNSLCGKVNKSEGFDFVPETKSQKQGSKVMGDNTRAVVKSGIPKQVMPETPALVAGDVPTFLPRINRYTDEAWEFAESVLYPKNTFTEQQVILSKLYIAEYFSLIRKDDFIAHSQKLFLHFCERILLAKKYVDKVPSRFIPVPWTWFDKHFAGGFKGTLAWLKIVHAKRKNLKHKYENLTELCGLYSSYLPETTITSYKRIEAELLEKNDKELLNIYYGCVADKRNYNPAYLHQYYREGGKV